MRRFLLAIRAFFWTLLSGEVAAQIERVLSGEAPARLAPAGEPQRPPKPSRPPKPQPPARSDAVTLLAALQREARFVDFVKEPLSGYTDAQIGAAARDVHRDCGKVLERLFTLKPICPDEEGAQIEVPAGFDAGRYRLTGNVAGEPPFCGRMTHPGWEASKCELPAWSGSRSTARVVAPVEVELE